MILSLTLGDGCLHYIRNNGKTYGGLTIEHGIAQRDYQEWKAKLLSNLTGRNVKARISKHGKAIQLSVCMKRFRAWRKWLYPNGKKDVARILKYIENPWFAVAVWLMDDGYCSPSISKLATGEKKLYGARFRIFSMETPVNEQPLLIKWLEDNLGVTATVGFQKRSYRDDEGHPFLKFGIKDTLIIWEKIRDFVLTIPSMRHKFRHVEITYQERKS
jgi:hypothetical protein